ncbi:MAG: sigma-70 family RNA polymerase sigma factor [Oscillospiraceae bacterium]|nr:sigma-70 family RNA polymerase sigma factor [Oscillospiraceae bacterium]
MDDRELIALFFARQESAIERTSSKYRSYCSKIARNILRSEEDAEECVADTWLRAWNSIPPARPDNFAAYIGKITRNLALNRLEARSAARRGGGVEPLALDELSDILSGGGAPFDETELRRLTEAINVFLQTLDKAARLAFVRRYWLGDGISEIARLLDASDSKIKSMLLRARRKLKKHLETEGFDV